MAISTIEQRVGRALATLLAERKCDAATVERGLDLPAGRVARLVRGEGSLDLALLQRVLLALGADPPGFLGALLPGVDEPEETEATATGEAAKTMGREEIEALIEQLRSTVRGLVRAFDARAAADEESP